jgi:hypothetical protein
MIQVKCVGDGNILLRRAEGDEYTLTYEEAHSLISGETLRNVVNQARLAGAKAREARITQLEAELQKLKAQRSF